MPNIIFSRMKIRNVFFLASLDAAYNSEAKMYWAQALDPAGWGATARVLSLHWNNLENHGPTILRKCKTSKVNFSDIIGCSTSPWCWITNPWSLDPPRSGARARTRSFEIHGSLRALAPQPGGSRLHGLVIRHQGDKQGTCCTYRAATSNDVRKVHYWEFLLFVNSWFRGFLIYHI